MHLKIIKIIRSKTENLQETITMQGFQRGHFILSAKVQLST